MSTMTTVTVKILDKEYQIACPEEQQAELVASASYLDGQMRNIRETGKVIGLERIAVMAALNISHELIKSRQVPGEDEATDIDDSGFSHLNQKLDEALYQLRQLEIG